AAISNDEDFRGIGAPGIIGGDQGFRQSQIFNPWNSGNADLANDGNAGDAKLLLHPRQGFLLSSAIGGVRLSFGLGFGHTAAEGNRQEERPAEIDERSSNHGCSPGRFKIFPNSLSTGSISILPGACLPGSLRPRPV